MIEVNGMAHVILTVSHVGQGARLRRAVTFLGLEEGYDGNTFLYHVGGRIGARHPALRAKNTRVRGSQTGSACIICAFACARARHRQGRGETAFDGRRHRSAPIGGDLRRATTTSSSKIPTASDWR